MTYTSTITTKGQVTIPVELRNKLRIRESDKVSFEQKGDTIIIRAGVDSLLKKARADSQAHLKKKGLQNLSEAELKRRLDRSKKEYYAKKYSIS